MSHILLSPLCTFPCWRLSTSSLVWWQCPWHTLSSHNGVIVIPATHKVETLSSGLSLKLFPVLPFCVSFSSSLLLLHYISITHLSCLFILVCTHTNTHTHACTHACMHAHTNVWNFLCLIYFLHQHFLLPLERWCIDPPLQDKHRPVHTHCLHYPVGCIFVSLFCLHDQAIPKVLAQSKQPYLRCKGYNSKGIRRRIRTGGTNKPQARFPCLSLPFFFFFAPNSSFYLSLSSQPIY